MWDATLYLRFGGERARPFFDLLARVGTEMPRYVVDMGCGPGNLTATLAQRWPSATVCGVDNSPQMIETARQLAPAAVLRSAGSPGSARASPRSPQPDQGGAPVTRIPGTPSADARVSEFHLARQVRLLPGSWPGSAGARKTHGRSIGAATQCVKDKNRSFT